MKKILAIAIFSVTALTSCSLFEEDEPLPSELSRRSPIANQSPYSIPGNIATQGFPPLTMAAPAIPEPPILIGSSSVAPFPQSAPTQQGPAYSSMNLPTSSPVDLSAAQNSAAGLPVQRRAPAFNQVAGGAPIAAPISAPAQTIATPIMPEMTPSGFAKVTPIDPVEKFEQASRPPMPSAPPMPPMQNAEFPRLAQIPPAPTAISPNTDPRIQSLRSDLASARTGSSASSNATTNFANLKPLPGEPIYKIEPEPSIAPAQNYSQPPMSMPKAVAEPRRPLAAPVQYSQVQPEYSAPQNITRLSDLRPIAGAAPSGRGLRSASYKNVGAARHSTAYGY